MFPHIFSKNIDVQERNEGTPVEPQVQGIQDCTTEIQSSGSKKRTLQESFDSVGSSQSKYQRVVLETADSCKR